jgi:hypothetical protein
MDAMKKRFAEIGPDEAAPEELMKVLSEILRRLASPALQHLETSFNKSIQTLVPIDPLLALRIAGARSARLETLVKDYYQRISSRPELINDPNALRVLATIEEHTLDLAFKKARDQLASDIREIARSFWIFKRRRILKELENRGTSLSADEFEKQFGPDLDEMAETIKRAMMLTPIPPQPAGQ